MVGLHDFLFTLCLLQIEYYLQREFYYLIYKENVSFMTCVNKRPINIHLKIALCKQQGLSEKGWKVDFSAFSGSFNGHIYGSWTLRWKASYILYAEQVCFKWCKG